jgi:hypothetical protein
MRHLTTTDARMIVGLSRDAPDVTATGDAPSCTAGFIDVCNQPDPSMALDISTPRRSTPTPIPCARE